MPRLLHLVRLWGLVGVVTAQVALADPTPQARSTCQASNPQEAGIRADELFGSYLSHRLAFPLVRRSLNTPVLERSAARPGRG